MQLILLSLFLVGTTWAQFTNQTLFTFPPTIPIRTGPTSYENSTTPLPWPFGGVPLSTIIFTHRPGPLSNYIHSLPTNTPSGSITEITTRDYSESSSTTGRPWRWEYTGGRWRRVWNSNGSWNISGVGESTTESVQPISPRINLGYNHPTYGPWNHHLQVQSSHSSNYTQGIHDQNTTRQIDHKYSLTSDSGPSSPESGEGSDGDVSTSGSSGASGSSEGSGSGIGSGSE